MKVFCMKRRDGGGGGVFIGAHSLPFWGREKCQIIEMAFLKKLKPNLSKTLQVLGRVAIVREMNAIQFMLAARFSPLVHLLISKNIIRTLSPRRDLCSLDPRTSEHADIEHFHRLVNTEGLLLDFIW